MLCSSRESAALRSRLHHVQVERELLLADGEHGVRDDVRQLVRHLWVQLRPERRAGDGGEQLLVHLAVGADGALFELVEEEERGLLGHVEALIREGRVGSRVRSRVRGPVRRGETGRRQALGAPARRQGLAGPTATVGFLSDRPERKATPCEDRQAARRGSQLPDDPSAAAKTQPSVKATQSAA